MASQRDIPRPDPTTQERLLAHHQLARDLFDSAELLHRNLKDRQAAPLLRQAIDEELTALAILLGDDSGGGGARLLRKDSRLAPLRAGIDLPAVLAALDDIEARSSADPSAAPSRTVFRQLVEQAARFGSRADGLVHSALLSDRQRQLRHAARRAGLVALAALALIVAVALAWRAHTQRGVGLRGVYYADAALEALRTERVDRKLDFSWPPETPPSGLELGRFSVRWTGEVLAPEAGEYRFVTESDDGARLWVGGEQLVDAWVPQPATRHEGTVTLAAGWHPVRLDYFQDGGGAVCRLLWQPPAGVEEVVPPSHLRPH